MMIDILGAIQPLLIISLLTFFFTLETYIPDRAHSSSRKKHTARNLTLVLFCFAVNGLAASWFGRWIPIIQGRQWGLLNVLHLTGWAGVAVGILLIDLDSYAMHVVFHKVPALWRLHRVHHSDDELDSTSSLRVHPVETFLQATWRTASFAVIGVSIPAFTLYYTLLLPLLFIQHANLKSPRWVEAYLGGIFVMSVWHKVHHSDERPLTDSHFGNIFTFWDRLFGTSLPGVGIDRLKWGLKEFNSESDQTVRSQLLLPLRNVV
jgi:sterol desaturase/sphingolipid hydroxylase (fatty acid hydroxylase superfamily)